MKTMLAVFLVLGVASPVLAGGNAFDSFMQGYAWADQAETNREMRETMRQQREFQQRQMEEMEVKKKTYEASPQQVAAVNRELDKARAFIEERPEYKNNSTMVICLTSLAQRIITDPDNKLTDMTAVMYLADDQLKRMIAEEAERLKAKK